MISIIIPSRNEKFLQPTITSLLENATGSVEILCGLDGWWPVPALKDDKRVHILHEPVSIGMRPMINSMIKMAKGEFIMKIDAHCIVSKGFDEIMAKDCQDNWIVVPRQYSLNDDMWDRDLHKPTVDYWYLSPPALLAPGEYDGSQNLGLHGTRWPEFKSRPGASEKHIDDLMSFQGSCYFMNRKHCDTIEIMDEKSYGNFAYEAVELGMKTWMMGGRVVVNKNVWFAHLHKGKKHGRGYFLSRSSVRQAAEYCIDTWMNNKWQKSTMTMRQFVDKFAPVPGWENFDWNFKFGGSNGL